MFSLALALDSRSHPLHLQLLKFMFSLSPFCVWYFSRKKWLDYEGRLEVFHRECLIECTRARKAQLSIRQMSRNGLRFYWTSDGGRRGEIKEQGVITSADLCLLAQIINQLNSYGKLFSKVKSGSLLYYRWDFFVIAKLCILRLGSFLHVVAVERYYWLF